MKTLVINMPKIVTGAHGFVGRHIVDAILGAAKGFTEICVWTAPPP